MAFIPKSGRIVQVPPSNRVLGSTTPQPTKAFTPKSGKVVGQPSIQGGLDFEFGKQKMVNPYEPKGINKALMGIDKYLKSDALPNTFQTFGGIATGGAIGGTDALSKLKRTAIGGLLRGTGEAVRQSAQDLTEIDGGGIQGLAQIPKEVSSILKGDKKLKVYVRPWEEAVKTKQFADLDKFTGEIAKGAVTEGIGEFIIAPVINGVLKTAGKVIRLPGTAINALRGKAKSPNINFNPDELSVLAKNSDDIAAKIEKLTTQYRQVDPTSDAATKISRQLSDAYNTKMGLDKVLTEDVAAKTFKIKQGVPTNAGIDTYLDAFQVHRVGSQSLKPTETAKVMIRDRVYGTLDEIQGKAMQVTGDTGAITQMTRNALREINGEIPIENISKTVNNTLNEGITITPNEVKKIQKEILKTIKPGATPHSWQALDAYDALHKLEKRGYFYIDKAEKSLVPDIHAQEIGKVYVNAAKEISDTIDKTLGKQGVMQTAKTAEALQQLSDISPALLKEALDANNISELRHVAMPYVRINKMAEITKSYAINPFSKLAKSVTGTNLTGMAKQATFDKLTSPQVTTRLGTEIGQAGGVQEMIKGKLQQWFPTPQAVQGAGKMLGQAGQAIQPNLPQIIPALEKLVGRQVAQKMLQESGYGQDQGMQGLPANVQTLPQGQTPPPIQMPPTPQRLPMEPSPAYAMPENPNVLGTSTSQQPQQAQPTQEPDIFELLGTIGKSTAKAFSEPVIGLGQNLGQALASSGQLQQIDDDMVQRMNDQIRKADKAGNKDESKRLQSVLDSYMNVSGKSAEAVQKDLTKNLKEMPSQTVRTLLTGLGLSTGLRNVAGAGELGGVLAGIFGAISGQRGTQLAETVGKGIGGSTKFAGLNAVTNPMIQPLISKASAGKGAITGAIAGGGVGAGTNILEDLGYNLATEGRGLTPMETLQSGAFGALFGGIQGSKLGKPQPKLNDTMESKINLDDWRVRSKGSQSADNLQDLNSEASRLRKIRNRMEAGILGDNPPTKAELSRARKDVVNMESKIARLDNEIYKSGEANLRAKVGANDQQNPAYKNLTAKERASMRGIRELQAKTLSPKEQGNYSESYRTGSTSKDYPKGEIPYGTQLNPKTGEMIAPDGTVLRPAKTLPKLTNNQNQMYEDWKPEAVADLRKEGEFELSILFVKNEASLTNGEKLKLSNYLDEHGRDLRDSNPKMARLLQDKATELHNNLLKSEVNKDINRPPKQMMDSIESSSKKVNVQGSNQEYLNKSMMEATTPSRIKQLKDVILNSKMTPERKVENLRNLHYYSTKIPGNVSMEVRDAYQGIAQGLKKKITPNTSPADTIFKESGLKKVTSLNRNYEGAYITPTGNTYQLEPGQSHAEIYWKNVKGLPTPPDMNKGYETYTKQIMDKTNSIRIRKASSTTTGAAKPEIDIEIASNPSKQQLKVLEALIGKSKSSTVVYEIRTKNDKVNSGKIVPGGSIEKLLSAISNAY